MQRTASALKPEKRCGTPLNREGDSSSGDRGDRPEHTPLRWEEKPPSPERHAH